MVKSSLKLNKKTEKCWFSKEFIPWFLNLQYMDPKIKGSHERTVCTKNIFLSLHISDLGENIFAFFYFSNFSPAQTQFTSAPELM